MKRSDYIRWNEYFMSLALLSAARSKDPHTQVGACIVKDNKVVGLGYNGLPNGMSDDECEWKRDGEWKEQKYCLVCHAELNAISNCLAPEKLQDSTIYVSLFPCNECAKLIVQSGIKKVVYLNDKYNGTDANIIAKKIFEDCSVIYLSFGSNKKTISIDLENGIVR